MSSEDFRLGQLDVIGRYERYFETLPCANDGACVISSKITSMCHRCQLLWFLRAERREQPTPVKSA